MVTSPLSAAERAALRAQLLDERVQVERRLAGLLRTFDELVAAADLEPPDDEHDPDGTTAYERAQVTSLAGEARRRLADLDAAIAAVEDASYGACEACGGPIGIDRLQAVPGARRCIGCAGGRAPPTR